MDTLYKYPPRASVGLPGYILSGLHLSVSHERLDRKSVVARQRQPSAKRRPQIVPFQIANFRFVTSGSERSLNIRVGLLRFRVNEPVLVSPLLSLPHSRLRQTEDEHHFIAMEYIDGVPLRQRMGYN